MLLIKILHAFKINKENKSLKSPHHVPTFNKEVYL